MYGLTNLEEDFLEFLLKSYYRENTSYIHSIIDIERVKNAVYLFQEYFDSEDSLNITNHTLIIKKVFIEDCITNKNCGFELGISSKTFYRYKQKYLRIFKNYLVRVS